MLVEDRPGWWLSGWDTVQRGVLLYLYLTIPTVHGATNVEDDSVIEMDSEMSDTQKTFLTIGLTFPLALLVGVLWCLCMTKVCGISNHRRRPGLTSLPARGLGSSPRGLGLTPRHLSRSYDEQTREEILEDEEEEDDYGGYEEQGITMDIPNEIPDRPWRLRADSF